MQEPDNGNNNGLNLTMEINNEVAQNEIPTRNDNVANTINELKHNYENVKNTIETLFSDIGNIKQNITTLETTMKRYTDMTTTQNKSMEDILKQLDHYARYIKK